MEPPQCPTLWCSAKEILCGTSCRAHHGKMHTAYEIQMHFFLPVDLSGESLAALPCDRSLSRKWGNELPDTKPPSPHPHPVFSQEPPAPQTGLHLCSYILWQLEFLTIFPFGETFIKYYNQFNFINTLEPLSSPQRKTQYFSITSNVWSDIYHRKLKPEALGDPVHPNLAKGIIWQLEMKNY